MSFSTADGSIFVLTVADEAEVNIKRRQSVQWRVYSVAIQCFCEALLSEYYIINIP